MNSAICRSEKCYRKDECPYCSKELADFSPYYQGEAIRCVDCGGESVVLGCVPEHVEIGGYLYVVCYVDMFCARCKQDGRTRQTREIQCPHCEEKFTYPIYRRRVRRLRSKKIYARG